MKRSKLLYSLLVVIIVLLTISLVACTGSTSNNIGEGGDNGTIDIVDIPDTYECELTIPNVDVILDNVANVIKVYLTDDVSLCLDNINFGNFVINLFNITEGASVPVEKSNIISPLRRYNAFVSYGIMTTNYTVCFFKFGSNDEPFVHIHQYSECEMISYPDLLNTGKVRRHCTNPFCEEVEEITIPNINSPLYEVVNVVEEGNCHVETIKTLRYAHDDIDITFDANCGYNKNIHDLYTNVIISEPTKDSPGCLVEHCDYCGHEESFVLPQFGTDEAKTFYSLYVNEPTCNDYGYERYSFTKDGETFTFDVTLPKLNHDLVYEITKVPTFAEDGELTTTCSHDCGYISYMYLPSVNFAQDYYTLNIIKDSTCTETGLVHATFTYADQEFEFDVVLDEIPHEYIYEVTKYPSFSEKGSYIQKCSSCLEETVFELPILPNEIYSKTEEIPETCTEDGYDKYEFSIEGNAFEFKIVRPKTGHNLIHYDKIEPTCTSSGRMEYWYCNKCGESFSDAGALNIITNTYIPSLPHTNEGKYQMINDPTLNTSGFLYMVCSVCGHHLKEVFLQPLGYVLEENADLEANNMSTANYIAPHVYQDGSLDVLYYLDFDQTLTYTIDFPKLESECIDGIKYELDSSTGMLNIIGVDETAKDFTFVESVAGHEVNKNIPDVFLGRTDINSVTIPATFNTFDNMTHINDLYLSDFNTYMNNGFENVFSYCDNVYFDNVLYAPTELLFNEVIDNSIKRGKYSYIKSIKSITFKQNVIALYSHTFDNMPNLQTVIYEGESTSNINSYAFENSPVQYYKGSSAFVDCFGNLKKLELTKIERYINNSLRNLEELIILQKTPFDNYMFASDANKLKRAVVPYPFILRSPLLTTIEFFDGGRMNERFPDSRTYEGCTNLQEIILPEGLVKYNGLFRDMHIGTLEIPSTLKTVYGLPKCKNVKIKNLSQYFNLYDSNGYGLSNIMDEGGKLLLNNEVLTEITIPNDVEVLKAGLLNNNCSLNKLIVPNTVKKIDNNSLLGCANLQYLELPFAGYTADAYYGCALDLFSNTIDWSNVDPKLLPLDSLTELHINGGDLFEIKNVEYFKNLNGLYIADEVVKIEGMVNTNNIYLPSLERMFVEDRALKSSISYNLYVNNILVTDIVVPETVTSLYNGMFSGIRNITKVTVLGDVTFVGTCVFDGCENLHKIDVHPSVLLFDKDECINNNHNITEISIGYVTEIPNCSYSRRFKYLQKLEIKEPVKIMNAIIKNAPNLTDVTLPNTLTTIGHYALGDCYIKDIDLKNVTELQDGALEGNQLTRIDLSKIEILGNNALRGNRKLTEVILPNTLSMIGEQIFRDCSSLTSIDLKNLDVITKNMFANCTSLSSIILNNVKTINGNAFFGCKKLLELNLPEGLTRLEAGAFYGTYLNRVNIPSSIEYCGSFGNENYIDNIIMSDLPNWINVQNGEQEGITFNGNVVCPETLVIPTNITTIPAGKYQGLPFKFIKFPQDLIKIGDKAFFGCNNLEELILPDKLTTIGWQSFNECYKIKNDIVIPISVTNIGSNAFPTNTTALLTTDTLPSGFNNSFTCGRYILNYTIEKENLVTGDIIIHKNLKYRYHSGGSTSVGDFSLVQQSNSPSITHVEIPSTITYKNVTYPVTDISGYAFRYNDYIESIVIGEGVTYIADNAFDHCSKLKSITFPSTIDHLTSFSIYACPSIQTYIVNEQNNKYMSVDNSSLCLKGNDGQPYSLIKSSKLHIPAGIVEVDNTAFESTVYNPNDFLNIPSTVKHIGFDVFGSQEVPKMNLESKRPLYNATIITLDFFKKGLYINNQQITELTLDNNLIKAGLEIHGIVKIDFSQVSIKYVLEKDHFKNYVDLRTIIFNSGLTDIHDSFRGCNNIENVVLPNSLLTFEGDIPCKSLTFENNTCHINCLYASQFTPDENGICHVPEGCNILRINQGLRGYKLKLPSTLQKIICDYSQMVSIIVDTLMQWETMKIEGERLAYNTIEFLNAPDTIIPVASAGLFDRDRYNAYNINHIQILSTDEGTIIGNPLRDDVIIYTHLYNKPLSWETAFANNTVLLGYTRFDKGDEYVDESGTKYFHMNDILVKTLKNNECEVIYNKAPVNLLFNPRLTINGTEYIVSSVSYYYGAPDTISYDPSAQPDLTRDILYVDQNCLITVKDKILEKASNSSIIPLDVLYVNPSAYNYCNFTELVIPGNVISFQAYFTGCRNIKTIVLEEGVKQISINRKDESHIFDTLVIPSTIEMVWLQAFINNLEFTKIDHFLTGYYNGCEFEYSPCYCNITGDTGYAYSEVPPLIGKDGKYCGNFWHYNELNQIVFWNDEQQAV